MVIHFVVLLPVIIVIITVVLVVIVASNSMELFYSLIQSTFQCCDFDALVLPVIVTLCVGEQHQRRGAVQLRRGLRAPGQQNHQLSASGGSVRGLE